MIRTVILLFFTTGFYYHSSAQVKVGNFSDDHLEPAPNYFASYNYQHSYYSLIRQYLFDSLSQSPLARVVVKPSFSEEYVVSIDSTDRQYYLTYNRMNKSIWYTKEKELLRVVQTRTGIDKDLAILIQQLFFEAAAQTRYRKRRFIKGPFGKEIEQLSFGTDGTTYVFMSFGHGHGIWSGQTWSPAKNTRMGALVNITYSMVKLAKEPDHKAANTEALRKQCQVLLVEIAEPR